MPRLRAAYFLALAVFALAACGRPAPAAPAELTVFAAASLTGAFRAIGEQFSAAHGGAHVAFNFAGSDQLAAQIAQGAAADVFAPANPKQMDVVIKAGEVTGGASATFARNRLVVVYPRENPGRLAALADLARPGLKIVLANANVPAGAYALDVLARAARLPEYTAAFSPMVLANVVSYEENVKAVISKVALGEADAAIVYATDAAAVTDGSIAQLSIPNELNTLASYPIAATRRAQNATLARQFVDFVLGPVGQRILAEHGFLPANGG